MKAIVLVCLVLSVLNVVSSEQVLEAEKLLKYIIENARNNEDSGLSARLLYSLGKQKQKSSPTYNPYGSISAKAKQAMRNQRIQQGPISPTPFDAPAPQPTYDAPAPQRVSVPVPQPTYDAPAPQRVSAPAPQPTYAAPAPPQRVSVPVAPQPTYAAPAPPQRVSVPAPSYGGQQSGSNYGGYGSQGGRQRTGSVGGCVTEPLDIEKDGGVLPFQSCICADGGYSTNGCQQSFPSPCDGVNQLFNAHPSFGPQFFVHCSNNLPYLKTCPADLVWNANLVTCAWNAADGMEVAGQIQQSVQGFDQPQAGYGGY